MNSATASVVTVQLRMALSCIVLALLGGAMSVLHYIPEVSARLNEAGLTLPQLRPVHTTFVTLWIYGAAIAMVYDYLGRLPAGLDRGDLRRFWFHTACWISAGVGIFVTLLAGVFSGREYMEYHPAFSIPLLAGWVAFAWTFLKRAFRGFWQQPAYVWMWTTGTLLFMFAFVEAHLWLLPSVQENPLRDLQIQWKTCGTLVGSFNFLVYGALAYAKERISGDPKAAQSPLTFWLFGVGCLNSFTNYVHHTYHLPQNEVSKWVAFVVSMAEVIILWYVMIDVVKAMRAGRPQHPALQFFVSARAWTGAMLILAMVISVPNLNSVMHGTLAVTAHAMGTEIGIDSLVLFGVVTWLLAELHKQVPARAARVGGAWLPVQIRVLNLATATLVGWLLLAGTWTGVTRIYGGVLPEWVTVAMKYVFPIAGGAVALSLLGLVARWAPLVLFSTKVGAVPVGGGATPSAMSTVRAMPE